MTTPYFRALSATYVGQLSRGRAAGGAVLFVAALQSLGILLLLRGTMSTASETSRAAIASGTTVLVIAFISLNLLAQRLGSLKAEGGLDYYGTLPVAPSAVVLGIAATYNSFTLPGVLVTGCIGLLVFHLSFAHLWVLIPVLITAGIAYSGIGALLGLALPRQELATIAGQLGMTAVLFLGVIPPERFPPAVRGVRAVLPVSYDVDALTAAFTRAPDWTDITLRLTGAALFGIACLTAATWFYRRALRR